MSNSDNLNYQDVRIDRIQNSVSAHPDTIGMLASAELGRSRRIHGSSANAFTAFTILEITPFGSFFNSLMADRFHSILYEAILF